MLVLLGVQLLAQFFGNGLQMHEVAEAAASALAHFIISATSLIEIMVLSEDIIFRLLLYSFYKIIPLGSW